MSISTVPLAGSEQVRAPGKHTHTVAVAHGDGIGPEIMAATLRILEEKGIVRRGEKSGRAHTYVAAVSRDVVRLGMLRVGR